MLILRSAQFEYQVKSIFQGLLDSKVSSWESCKKQASDRMNELSDYFSGEKALTRVKKNENLQKWFKAIGTRISNLDFSDSTVAGRRIQQVIADTSTHIYMKILLLISLYFSFLPHTFLLPTSQPYLFPPSVLPSLSLSAPSSARRSEGVPSDRREHSGEGVPARRHRVLGSDDPCGQCEGAVPRHDGSRGGFLLRMEDCRELHAAHPQAHTAGTDKREKEGEREREGEMILNITF